MSERKRRADASMTLLNEVIHRPLDGGYAEAKARREAGEIHPWSAPRVVILTLLAIVLGFATITTVRVLRTPAPEATEARTLMEEEITSRSDDLEALQREYSTTLAEIEQLQNQALHGDSSLTQELRITGVASGLTQVTGPGVEIELSDGPTENSNAGQIHDVDLQLIINSLWASQAEAISINGNRLTSQTTIRAAGSAIMVNLKPLQQPYVIEAIGPANELQVSFARSPGGELVQTLKGFGVDASISASDSLSLRGVGVPVMRFAEPLDTEGESDESEPSETSTSTNRAEETQS